MEKTTVLITGGTNGIGFETAKALAKQKLRVIIGCRDTCKGEKCIERIIHDVGGDADVQLGPALDLSRPDSIRSFVKSYDYPLHVLINNAGIYESTSDAYAGAIPEIVQVNYLGPFLLTLLMEEKLIKHAGLSSCQSRVINVSSVMQRFSTFGKMVLRGESFSDMLTGIDGRSNTWYAATKLANVLFTSYMSVRWKIMGANVHSVAVDPGSVVTGIWKDSKWEDSWLIKLMFAPASDGAKAVIHAATVNFDEEENIDVRPIKKALLERSKKRPNEVSQNFEDPADFPDFRLYARGAFTWPTLTNVTYPSSWRGLLHSTIDWPLRNLSRGLFASKTVPVRANLDAYNVKIAEKLFQASAKQVGVTVD